MDSLLDSLLGFFKGNSNDDKNVAERVQDSWVPTEPPVDSYLQSVEIPELWVRIFLEVDALSFMSKKNKKKAKPEPHAMVMLSYVCRAWRDVAHSNDVWKVLSQRRWKTVRAKAKIRSWMKFYSRRYLMEKGLAPLKAHEISNCQSLEFEFECPMILESMRSIPTLPEPERYCEKCNERVYVCRTEEEVIRHVAQQHCVAFDKNVGRYSSFRHLAEIINVSIIEATHEIDVETFYRTLIQSVIKLMPRTTYEPITTQLSNVAVMKLQDMLDSVRFLVDKTGSSAGSNRSVPIVCFSLSDRRSWNEAKQIADKLDRLKITNPRNNRGGVFVGLHTEAQQPRQMTSDDGHSHARKYGWEYFELTQEFDYGRDLLHRYDLNKILQLVKTRDEMQRTYTVGIMI